MKRQLTKEERDMTEKAILRLQDDLLDLDFYKSYNELMLNGGLETNVRKQKTKFKEDLSNATQEYDILKEQLNVLQDQLKNGVEVKEKK